MFGKGFQEGLAYSVPERTELDFVAFVEPIGLNGGCKDSIAIHFQCGVRVAEEAVEGRFRCLEHLEAVDTGANRGSLASSEQGCCAFFLSGCFGEGEGVRLAAVADTGPWIFGHFNA